MYVNTVICVCIYVCVYKYINTYTKKTFADTPSWYRVAKTHRIPYLYRSFSAKVTSI